MSQTLGKIFQQGLISKSFGQMRKDFIIYLNGVMTGNDPLSIQFQVKSASTVTQSLMNIVNQFNQVLKLKNFDFRLKNQDSYGYSLKFAKKSGKPNMDLPQLDKNQRLIDYIDKNKLVLLFSQENKQQMGSKTQTIITKTNQEKDEQIQKQNIQNEINEPLLKHKEQSKSIKKNLSQTDNYQQPKNEDHRFFCCNLI